MYVLFLTTLAVGFLHLVLYFLRRFLVEDVGPEPVKDPPPWWLGLVRVPVGLLVLALVGFAFHRVIAVLEYLMVSRRQCPDCGQRNWSWGYPRPGL
jgi:hypothetical protein